MGRVEDGHAALPQLVDGLEDGVAALRVDADGGLVEHQQLRLVQQADADVEATLHAAGVVVGAVVGAVGRPVSSSTASTRSSRASRPQPLEPAEEAQVLASREVGVDGQVLGHVADGGLGLGGVDVDRLPGHGDLAAVALEQAADHRDGGGLAGAVGTQQAVGLAAGDVEADAVDGDPFAVALAQVATHEQRLDLGHPSPSRLGVASPARDSGIRQAPDGSGHD